MNIVLQMTKREAKLVLQILGDESIGDPILKPVYQRLKEEIERNK